MVLWDNQHPTYRRAVMKQDFACEEVDSCKPSKCHAFFVKALGWGQTEVCTIKIA